MDAVTRSFFQHGIDLSLITTPGYKVADLPQFGNVWTAGKREAKYSIRWWIDLARRNRWSDWKPDAIFSVSSASLTLRIARRSVPAIAHCHGTAVADIKSSLRTLTPREALKVPLNIGRIPREVVAYRDSELVIAVGDGVADQLRRWPYRIPEEKLITVDNGVDVSIYGYSEVARVHMRRQWGITGDCSVGVFIGRLHSQKGADIAISALAEMGHGARLIICGEGPDERRLRRRAHQLGVGKDVLFLGKTSMSLTAAVLSASDVLLLPSRRVEGAPLALLEGMASRIPIVTSSSVPLPRPNAARVVDRLSASQFAMEWRRVVPGQRNPDHLDETLTSEHMLRELTRHVRRVADRTDGLNR